MRWVLEPWVPVCCSAGALYWRCVAHLLRLPARLLLLTAPPKSSLQMWNGMFSQTQYALERGKALQLDPDAYTALCKFYSRRAQQVSRRGAVGREALPGEQVAWLLSLDQPAAGVVILCSLPSTTTITQVRY